MDAYGDRQAQLDAVEAMLGYARENQKAANSNQSSLFGSATLSRARFVWRRRYHGKSDRLAWEKELLGLYVSEHPWQQWEKMLAAWPPRLSKLWQTGRRAGYGGRVIVT